VQRVLPQVFAGSDVRCIVGGQSIKTAHKIGPVSFYPYVPAGDLLPHCDWTICHGGQNTIIQSLSHGVPLLVFPGPIFERRYNAEKVTQAGVGYMGEKPDFGLTWLEEKLATQNDCTVRAAELSRRIRSYGGARAAVEAIEAWHS